ncbi:hypothetical protein LWI29_020846 [Acer saccharum]|uniref:DUF1677 family protein n=1 Tax=Acer saccharum TaxID=4024 RepID=A0AA39RD36_ACESA|nr:hypothetical protein LWI29_020846 [Acer saccharum]
MKEAKSISAGNDVTMMNGCDGGQSEVEVARCECCGLMEECTAAYIVRVRERFQGRWICGLCAEAVKDETCRYSKSNNRDDDITMDKALSRHMKFCEQFKSSSPPKHPTEDLISAMKNLVRRSLDSPRRNRSPPAAFVDPSKTCFSDLSN